MFRAAPSPARVTPRHPPRHGRAPPASASEFHRIFDRLEVLQRVGQVVLLEDEREGQDTYTSALGIGRSVALLLLCELFAVAFAFPLLQSNVGWVGVTAMAIVMGFGPLRFYRTPTSKNASLVETTSTLGALGVYILIAVDTGLIWGVAWT